MNKYTPIIGLETHVELKTKSKMFCGCSTAIFGEKPNTHTCPVCLGLPGALPVPNKQAIEWCIKISLALNCKINLYSKFDRKNYFYPDLAKGYQISQYDLPFGHDGFIELHNKKRIRIRRVHMEEDTGKLMHQNIEGADVSLIDFNRSGIPLVEIVTEPDFNDASEVKQYLQKLQSIVRFLDVSDADMEKGEMRLEPNISLSEDPKTLPSYKVEVKNINSFKFVEKAINFEIVRHEEILKKGDQPVQETRGWDENRQKTFSQRVKEEAHDYRYFPEPDIPPITHTEKQISTMKENLPELQDEKIARFQKEYSLNSYDAEILTREKALADYFEEAARSAKQKNISVSTKHVANFIINKKIDLQKTSPEELVGNIYTKITPSDFVDDKELENCLAEVIKENEKAVQEYKSGKENVIMYLVGQTLKKFGKKVDANLVKQKLIKKLT